MPQDRIRTIEVLLTIHSPVLQGTAKWKFVYEGKQVSSSIKDEKFLEKVSDGAEAFRNEDRLKVELEIGEKYVAAILDYERTNQYSIAEVLEHIPRPEPQNQLPLLSEHTTPFHFRLIHDCQTLDSGDSTSTESSFEPIIRNTALIL